MNDKEINEFSCALYHDAVHVVDDSVDVVVNVNNDYLNSVNLIKNISLAGKLAASEGDLFVAKKNSRTNRIELKIKPLGEELLMAASKGQLGIEYSFNKHKLNPMATVLIESAKRREMLRWFNPRNAQTESALFTSCDVCNSCVESIRKELKLVSFKNKYKNFERSCNKNFLSTKKVVDEVLEKNKEMQVVRLDLLYKFDKAAIIKMNNVGYEQAKENRDAFFKAIVKQKEAKEGLRCYIWSLRYTKEKGYHYHVLLMYNFSKGRDIQSLVSMMTGKWAEISDGKGVSCSKPYGPHAMAQCGVTIVRNGKDVASQESRANFNKIIAFFTKMDFFAKLSFEGLGDCFGKVVLD